MAAAHAVMEMTDEEFQRQTLDVIRREFGLSGLTRFIRAYRSSPGDYTRDRHLWQRDMTVAQIAAELETRYGPLQP